MNKYSLIIICLVITLISSCAPKQEKTIAIGVMLTLPEDIYDQSVQLNQAILEKHSDNITLDDHHIPHITLLQCYIKESDLSKIEQALTGLYKTIENDILWADELQYAKDKNESFASIGIKRSRALMALHEQTITLLEPYITPDGSQESYIQNSDGTPIDDFTLAYVPKFVSDHSYEHYNPHISLGVAKVPLLDSLAQHNFKATKFQAAAIGVYQLGAFGTAQKRIWESE
ncbi:hypothetical protein [Gelidibacter maritimus]|uniref:2'-5' RNA ligase family protein n=1 Tax=Gelidibacter maritimus TaxID=2761487 RepID=A0A7W2M8N4_9FLAO|nr:hypothetical protein [Gelidibacter maritimus]MBA6154745.1 hypothetical protein [Gelidibacter maritimus]